MNAIIVYAYTIPRAREWARRNIEAHDSAPVYISSANTSALLGLRDRIIILVDTIHLPEDIMYVEALNTVIRVRSN